MDTVAITGGTGHLGRELVRLLKGTHRVRVLARTPGADPEVEWVRGDLVTGDGIAELISGAHTVVHAASCSPTARGGWPNPWRHVAPDVDVDATRLLLDAAAAAEVRHFLYPSVVGADSPATPYLRLKHTAEELVGVAEMPWTVLRATPMHWLVDRVLAGAARLPVAPLPTALELQPCAEADFAEHIAAAVREGALGQGEDFAGPEVLPLREVVRQWQQARRRRIRAVGVPAFGRLADTAAHLTAPRGHRGGIGWAEWLAHHDGT
ncbi:SDR family oxidoreductase [Saccharopolyspora sp. CA-218241]|uniref:SDR family oxidoreductase n=1 Tax=Saccharopolyspora sp. CA-218241 TaxID=3240027 RepID=UPI003D98E454